MKSENNRLKKDMENSKLKESKKIKDSSPMISYKNEKKHNHIKPFDYIESSIDESELEENESKNIPSESRCCIVHKPLYDSKIN